MNISQIVLTKFYNLVITETKKQLEVLFHSRQFEMNKKQQLYKFVKGSIMFEDASSGIITFDEKSCSDTNVEYFIYHVDNIIESPLFDKCFLNHISLFNLVLTWNVTKDEYIVCYDPEIAFTCDTSIPKEVFKEYTEIYNLFNSISFIVHSPNYFVKMSSQHQKPKISISINGAIYNRPDREYYVVFEDACTYTVQVYAIDDKKKRDRLVFGVWIDSEHKTISDMYYT